MEDVDWSKLRHAYGDAGDIPGLLDQLGGGNSFEQNEALYELFGSIWHQDTVYTATVEAVPILAKIARRLPDKECGQTIDLLGSIAFARDFVVDGHSYFSSWNRPSIQHPPREVGDECRDAVRGQIKALSTLFEQAPVTRAGLLALYASVLTAKGLPRRALEQAAKAAGSGDPLLAGAAWIIGSVAADVVPGVGQLSELAGLDPETQEALGAMGGDPVRCQAIELARALAHRSASLAWAGTH